MADTVDSKATAKAAAAKKTTNDPENVAVTLSLPKRIMDHFEKQAIADERSVNKFLARKLRLLHEQETSGGGAQTNAGATGSAGSAGSN